MQLLETINGSRLQEVYLWHFTGLESIYRLAVLFPTIKTLGIPGFGIPSDRNNYTLVGLSLCFLVMYLLNGSQDECIDCLGQFPSLENLCDSSLWPAIQAVKAYTKLEIIRKLYTQCPALKKITYWDSVTNSEADIVFFRDGLDVTWKHIV